jgi:HD-like signal output (HDOD) protein/ActR/RegA family two-component response regulator
MKKRILFVEDDPHLLHSLECALQPGPAEWDMGFVESAETALRLMDRERFDVLVSDLHMPGMDGASLLNEASRKHPNIIRFILASLDDKELVMKQVCGAHQFLAKPCEAGALKDAIQCALALDVWLGNRKLQELVGRIRTFPSLPSLYFEVMRELNSPNASTEKIGDIISRDLSMTTKMLRMLNSAYFGLSRQITEPAEAVGFLGLETVKSLILAIQVFSQYDNVKPLFFSIDRLWRHSTMIARSAKQIARWETGDDDLADNAYTAGLLHDMGRLVLAFNFDEQYHGAQSIAKKQQAPLWEIEKQIFGASHAEVGAYLIGLWGLPLEILEAAALHHYPRKTTLRTFTPLTAVHVANAIHYEQHPDKDGFAAPPIDLDYIASLGLSDRLEFWRASLADDSAPAGPAAASKDAPPLAPVVLPPVAPGLETGAEQALSFNWRSLASAVGILGIGCALALLWIHYSSSRLQNAGSTGASDESAAVVEPGTGEKTNAVNQAVAPVEEPAANTPAVASQPPPTFQPSPAANLVQAGDSSTSPFPPLQLQGILYSPAKPKAIINGQTVSIDDQIEGAKVISIGPMSVIVRFEGKNKVLSQ